MWVRLYAATIRVLHGATTFASMGKPGRFGKVKETSDSTPFRFPERAGTQEQGIGGLKAADFFGSRFAVSVDVNDRDGNLVGAAAVTFAEIVVARCS